MQTPRPIFARREDGQDIPKKGLFYTPVKKPCSQLAKKEDGEGNTSIAKENPKATENLLVARINGANVHEYNSCSTPIIKTPFGTPSQLQTPTSKLSFFSARGNTHSVGAGGCCVNEDASITRTPFGLLAGKNLNACLFSPSHTPRPIAFPVPFDKLASPSPSLKGHAKRVLWMLPQLSPPRRVPVKQKRSQSTTTGKQSPFVTTPKSSRVDNVQFVTPKSNRVDNVQFVTPKSSRVDDVLKAAGRNDDGNVRQHHDVRNVDDVNYTKKNLEESAWRKGVLTSTPQQSPFDIPNSSRVEHVLKTPVQNNGVSGGIMMQHHDPDVKHGRAILDRAELLNRMLASMPHPSSPARRVPLRRQKQKQPMKSSSPLHHKEKQQSSNKKSLTETPKTCKSGQRGKKTDQNEAGGLDANKRQQAAGSHQKATKKVLMKRVTKGKARDGTDKAKQRVAKGKAGDGKDKAKQQNVDNYEIKGDSSKQHDEDIGNNVKHHEACDVDVGCEEYRDAEYDGIDTKHCDDDATMHHADDDSGEDAKCQFDNDRDDQKQHEDSHVDVGGADDTKECHRHDEDDNGTEQHDHDEGDICIGSSDDMDGEKPHGDVDTANQHAGDDTAKQHDHVNGVKQHNDDADDKLHPA